MYYPQESWELSRHAVDQLGLDTELEDKVATIITDVERVLDEWTKRRSHLAECKMQLWRWKRPSMQ